MASLPLYGPNNAWPQFNQPRLPLADDYSFSAQPQPQSSYPYQQFLPTSVNPGDTPTQSSHHYSSPTSVGQTSPQIEQSYYPQPSHPTFPATSPTFIGPPFYQSPQQSTPLSLQEALSPEAVTLSSSPAYPYGQTVTLPHDQYYPSSSVLPKRSRESDQSGDQDNVVDDEPPTDGKDASAKPKLAACTRCKSLKVKCEMKTETEPCKRCFNTGHPCLTPTKKQRRTPPKREHLMNQIREQAAHIQELMGHIQKLMSQLETRNEGSIPNGTSSTSGTEFDPTSPLLSSSSFEPSDNWSHSGPTVSPEVQEWLNQAKKSIDAFEIFVGMDSEALLKTLGDEDPEDDQDSEEDVDDDVVIVDATDHVGDDSHIEISVQHAEDDGVEGTREQWDKITLSDAHPNGSASSQGAVTPPTKKKELPPSQSTAIPAKTSPWGLFNTMSKKMNHSRKGSEASSENGDAVLGEDFFRPSQAPDVRDNLLSQNIVTPQEVEKLFAIYFDNMNSSLSLLDPVLYTAKKTYCRSSFLFTVICAIASRYYTERPELYPRLMHYAQLCAGRVLVFGKKSVEVCHGFILLSLYPIATRRWEEDRSWIYLGLAIRLATDLNLHHPIKVRPQNEYQAREVLNRERLWLNCFNLDRSMGSQYGKASIIKNTDYIACHSEDWWKSSPYNMSNFDIHICAYNAELRVMSAFKAQIYNDPNHPTGLNKEVDFEKLASETDDQLAQLKEKWFAILATTDTTNSQNHFRSALLRLGYSYARLIALSFGFQHDFSKNHTVENPFLQRCIRAASDVVTAVVDDIASLPNQRVYLRHGPEAHSVFVTFAAAFLIKLLQPKFALYITSEKRQEMRMLVKKTVDHLASPDIAVDNRHGPKLYAKFLEGLLAAPIARSDSSDSTIRKRVSRRLKSSTSQSPEPVDVQATTSNGLTASPQTAHLVERSSPSPKPSRAALSFDLFAPILAGCDPFAPASARNRNTPGALDQNQNGLAMGTDFFNQPSFDDTFMTSMQALPSDDSMVWETAGFDWMTDLQNMGSTFAVGQYSS